MKTASNLASWQAAVSGTTPWDVAVGAGVSGLVEGDAEGVLYGGCLSILVASLGTPYEIKTEGTILFLEDLAAKPYQIDRMLMQLKLAGHLDAVRGIVFGEMLDCVQTANQGYTLQEVVTRIVGDLGVPVAFGVRSGHVTSGNITLPFGVRAKLTVRGGQVAFTDIGISGHALKVTPTDIEYQRDEQKKAHSPDWHMRHGDGLAGGNAEAARISRHRLRRRCVSADVGFFARVGHSRGAAIRCEES